MTTLPPHYRDEVIALSKLGLTATVQAFLTNFMLAEKNGRGFNNLETFLERIRLAPDAAKAAAMIVFDGFVNDGK